MSEFPLTHKTKGGNYDYVGTVKPAGSLKATLAGKELTVYRNDKGELFVRETEDYLESMVHKP